MVDRNIPWRIVADIGSAPMMEYAAQYGLTNTNQILSSHYTPASQHFFSNLKRILWTLYGRVKPRIIIEQSQKGLLEREFRADQSGIYLVRILGAIWAIHQQYLQFENRLAIHVAALWRDLLP